MSTMDFVFLAVCAVVGVYTGIVWFGHMLH